MKPRFLCSHAAVAIWAGLACGQSPTWKQLLPANNPPARVYAASAHDTATGAFIVYGGNSPGDGTSLSDTWVWNGKRWAQMQPAANPGPRYAAAMAYDSHSGQAVLFGGTLLSASAPYSDTWVWDGTNWTEIQPAVSPPARFGAAMAYDSHSGRIFMFGGYTGPSPNEGGVFLNDTWAWNGTTWVQLTTALTPPGRDFASMAPATVGELLLFGGAPGPLDDTWVWNSKTTAWTQLRPANSPSPRFGVLLDYDSTLKQVVLFGGSLDFADTFYGDTWLWDGTNWTQQMPANSPSARGFTVSTYDAKDKGVLMFGGAACCNGNIFSDTWVYK